MMKNGAETQVTNSAAPCYTSEHVQPISAGESAMPRTIRAPRGTQLTCKNWLIEAAYRMLQNNLDPQVAGDPANLIVYGGRGKAARNWECFDAILESLRELENDETLLIQSGKPVGVFKTTVDSPRVLISNSMLVPHWANLDHFW